MGRERPPSRLKDLHSEVDSLAFVEKAGAIVHLLWGLIWPP